MRGIKYTAKEKQKALQMWIVEGKNIFYVAKKFKCTMMSLYRWKRLYDGTTDSLQNKSSRPHSPHPKAHTYEETEEITKLLSEHPNIGYTEVLGVLRTKYGYSRSYGGMYRFIVKNGLRPHKTVEKRENHPYDTPKMLGVKMQMDVKFVPLKCNKGSLKKERFYQYTIIDEATRERFIYPYKEHNGNSTVDFVKRAIIYFGYVPKIIQTDNGFEFTNSKRTGNGNPHIVDKLLNKLKIKHQLIRPYTPRHNGKVERSHRTDQEFFYNRLEFVSFDDLKQKMSEWLNRYNNLPHSAIKNREGKKVWQTPLQKRNELIENLIITDGQLKKSIYKEEIA